MNEWTAQVNSMTRRVVAVVRMINPNDAPPEGLEFVPTDDPFIGGKYYVNGVFQAEAP